MAVRSKRLFGPLTVTTATQVLYTCPAAETALVKLITAVNIAALGGTLLSLRINGSLGGQLVGQKVIPNGQDEWIEGFLVLNPGDVLRGTASQASLIVSGFGAELEGFAD